MLCVGSGEEVSVASLTLACGMRGGRDSIGNIVEFIGIWIGEMGMQLTWASFIQRKKNKANADRSNLSILM